MKSSKTPEAFRHKMAQYLAIGDETDQSGMSHFSIDSRQNGMLYIYMFCRTLSECKLICLSALPYWPSFVSPLLSLQGQHRALSTPSSLKYRCVSVMKQKPTQAIIDIVLQCLSALVHIVYIMSSSRFSA